MSRDGVGNYNLPSPPTPFVAGTTILSSDVNSVLSDIASALSQSVSADGQTPLTGTLNLNTHAIINVTSLIASGTVAAGPLSATTGAFSGAISAASLNTSGNAAAGGLVVQAAAGTGRNLFFQSGITNRWVVFADSSAETGANAGSNLSIAPYNDGGTLMANALTINRATGNISTGAVSATGNISTGATVSAGALSATGAVSAASASVSGTATTGTLNTNALTASGVSALNGGATAPTRATADSTTNVATTAFVNPASTVGNPTSRTNSDGTIQKQGSFSGVIGTGGTLNFAAAFPSICTSCILQMEGGVGTGYVLRLSLKNTSGFIWSWDQYSTTGLGNACTINWRADGY